MDAACVSVLSLKDRLWVPLGSPDLANFGSGKDFI